MSNEIEQEEELDPKNRGLGRGLSALFDDEEAYFDTEGDENMPQNRANSTLVPIESLAPSAFQPRRVFDSEAIEELSKSIEKHGIIQPILVRVLETGSYEIVAGERRWRAAQKAKLHEVPVVIKELDDLTTLEIALIENIQREDLNILEEAEAYQRLLEEFDHTQQSLSKVVGKSRSHVANTMRLLSLPDEVKGYVVEGQISAGHARAILAADDPVAFAKEIIEGGLSVRDAEAGSKGKKPKSNKVKPEKDVDTKALEEEMTGRLGTKVEINLSAKGGKLVVHYSDLDQLDEFLHRLSYNSKS